MKLDSDRQSPLLRVAFSRALGAMALAIVFCAALPMSGCLASPPTAIESEADSGAATDAGSESLETLASLARRPVTPPFFRIGDGRGATLLVLGTMHLGPAGGWIFSPEIERGLREADSFILEIDLREATEEEVANVLAERVILPVSVTLDQVISPETAKLLEEHEDQLARLGMSRRMRSLLEPWFIAVSLVESLNRESGLLSDQSVDNAVLERSAGRPLVGLETFDAQLAMLDGLSRELKDVMLRDTVMRLDESAAEMRTLAAAWSRNDRDALFEIAYQGVEETPELEGFYDVLLADRNRTWTTQLTPLLEDPARAGQTIFVGVGALHLVGPESLIVMLEAAGHPAQALHRAKQ